MKLLDADKVEKEKDRSEEERRATVKRINDEEIASVRRLNEALAEEKREKTRIAEDLTIARNSAIAETKKSVLLAEIKSLEERRQEALKPIDDLRKEAQEQFEGAKKFNAESQLKLVRAERLREDFEDKLDSLGDREESVLEKNRELTKREAGGKASEGEVKRSTESLSKQWGEYHKESTAFIADIKSREDKVVTETKANDIKKAFIEKKEAEIMQPIEVLRSVAEKAIEDNKILSISLKRRSDDLDEKELSLVEKDIKLNAKAKEAENREIILSGKEQDIERRYGELKAEEKRVKQESEKRLEAVLEEENNLKDRTRKVGYQEESNTREKTRLIELQEEAKKAVHGVAIKEDSFIRRETEVLRREEESALRLQNAKIFEKEGTEKREELIKREEIVIETEQVAKKIVQKTAEEREAFEAEVSSTMLELNRKEKELEDLTRANQSFKANLDEISKQQLEDRRAIKDGYETLARAQNEILGKK